MLTIDDFKKIEIKVGHILTAEQIEGSEKLLKLSVDFGEVTPRQVLSGIARYFPNPDALIDKKCAFITNLEPRKMMGFESQAMILAAHSENEFSLCEFSKSIPAGVQIG
jgi:methionyl-tRNA synthetase